jgi:hypothetical protein
MAITPKINNPIWVVSLQDPALLKLNTEAVEKYGITRDLKHLDLNLNTGVLNATGEPVTMFKILPIKQDYKHLIEIAGCSAFRKILRAHVIAVKNIDNFDIVDGLVTEEFCEQLGEAFIAEIANVCTELAMGKNGTTYPFSLPGGWHRMRASSMDLLAIFASSETAKTQKQVDSE